MHFEEKKLFIYVDGNLGTGYVDTVIYLPDIIEWIKHDRSQNELYIKTVRNLCLTLFYISKHLKLELC